jgi:D-alanyl-D-alanine carboxypeptidase
MWTDHASFCHKAIVVTCGLGLVVMVSGFAIGSADSRERNQRHRHFAARAEAQSHRAHAPIFANSHLRRPPRGAAVDAQTISAIVVDANSGRTLYARSENEQRGPASITKVMTLYLLFEQLEKGKLRLDSTIPISAHSAIQAPTKLGLRAGSLITVEDAIQAVVTRSANDIAVAIAEAIGGDEASFAEMMTRKAHALGMLGTHFVNASGLPDDAQVTTASDLAILGRAIQDHFPESYRFFATRTFTYRGAAIRNHNHLLERCEGMDGIKTGYTRASGFNLLASVRRGGRHIVAVVLGGKSAGHRDRIMADLIEAQIVDGATMRTAGPIPLPNAALAPVTVAARGSFVPQAVPADRVTVPPRDSDPKVDPKMPFVPVSLKPGLTVETPPIRSAGLGLAVPADRPRPAYVAAAPQPRKEVAGLDPAAAAPSRISVDGSTTRGPSKPPSSGATTTPSVLRRPAAFVGTQDNVADPIAPRRPAERVADRSGAVDLHPVVARRGEWTIQIAATNDLTKANDLLARAKQEGARALESATPTTEKILKGSETLYRARFTGLEADAAESACRQLKRSGFNCFVARN